MKIPEERCGQCCHFRQHYVKMGQRFSTACCGHCVYPNVKKRDQLHKACQHYKPRT